MCCCWWFKPIELSSIWGYDNSTDPVCFCPLFVYLWIYVDLLFAELEVINGYVLVPGDFSILKDYLLNGSIDKLFLLICNCENCKVLWLQRYVLWVDKFIQKNVKFFLIMKNLNKILNSKYLRKCIKWLPLKGM